MKDPATAATERKPGPLAGIKVIEMGTLIAGPYGARLLAEFGADVIKIEPPNKGDPIRNWRVLHNGTSLWWYVQSRNKKCITLDCGAPEGQAVLKALLAEADVLLENFRPGTLDKWGLTREALAEINPGLIVSRVSGFGQTGPYSKRPGFGAIGESMGGIRHLTGYPGMAPTRVGISLGDSVAALYAVIGILMALYHRDVHQGGGQEIDVALYEAVFSLMESMVPEYDQKKVVRERTGSVLPGIAPSNVYPTRDGKYAVIGANGDAIVQRLLKVMGREDMFDDERFANNAARVKHMQFIDDMISNWTRQYDLDAVLDKLNEANVPAGAIYSIEDIFRDAQYQARDMILDVEHPEFGKLKVPGIVPKLSKTPGSVEWLGPKLGEHNLDVLRGIGLTEEQIAQMAEKGVI
ncbi:CaiB/BaiF CoA transferase family protein [Massilia horti]|uniref:CoA transferase n=1 Tax=Massilia horti TaxID=2562153 RepID=A0A4Y9T2Q5_9BURK|nr:CaiB/BaiF CoA-transferase family protein [Massilia horti]TFW33442.1 CoA transferase [Massilia horti]